MKYKVGDKIKIKTWKAMEKKYGMVPDRPDCINCIEKTSDFYFCLQDEGWLNVRYPDRILTIKEIDNDAYIVERQFHTADRWTEEMIECSVPPKPKKVFKPVKNRFEIMDL